MELNDSQTIKLQINTNSYACKFEYKNNILVEQNLPKHACWSRSVNNIEAILQNIDININKINFSKIADSDLINIRIARYIPVYFMFQGYI